jgi:hypothetical protein
MTGAKTIGIVPVACVAWTTAAVPTGDDDIGAEPHQLGSKLVKRRG